MSERSKNPAQNVANVLNQLCAANLSTAASVHRLTELIGDYFQDEEFVQSESESSSDEEEDEVLPALAGEFVDIAHPDNVHDVDDMPALYAVAEAEPESDDENVPGPDDDVQCAMQEVDFINANIDKELTKIDDFHCECTRRGKNLENKVSCSKKLSRDFIAKVRMEMAALTDDERDLVLVAKISSLANFSEMTQQSKRTDNKRRGHQKTVYMVEGQTVCRDTFRFVHK